MTPWPNGKALLSGKDLAKTVGSSPIGVGKAYTSRVILNVNLFLFFAPSSGKK